MAITFGSNIASLKSIRYLNEASRNNNLALERLGSGLRINRASDDPAGIAVSSVLNVNARVYSQAIRNANDALSMVNIAFDGVQSFRSILTRLQELATQSSNGSFSFSQRKSLDKEAQQLVEEYNRLAASTSFNGLKVLGNEVRDVLIQLGYGTAATLNVQTTDALRRGVGSGGFKASTGLHAAGSLDTLTADINGDGKLDIARSLDDTGVLQVALGAGDGTFGTFTTVATLGKSIRISSLEAVDINKDGKLDLLLGTQDSKVHAYLGDGAGDFSPSASVTLSGSNITVNDIAAGDINGDGNIDFVVATDNSLGLGGSVYRLIGDGTGSSFSKSTHDSNPRSAVSIVIGDFDGNGIADFAYTHDASANIQIAKGLGGGSFSSIAKSASAAGQRLETFDLNRDGKDDIFVAGHSINVFLGSGDLSAISKVTYSNDNGYNRISKADINGDGVLDLVTYSNSDNYINVHKGNLDGTLESYSRNQLSETMGSGRIAMGDFNLDGVNDIVHNAQLSGSDFMIALGKSTDVTSLTYVDLTTQNSALSALNVLEEAAKRVDSQVGKLGAVSSRLESAIRNLFGLNDNTLAAESRIKDLDFAAEAANQLRQSILLNAASAVLAQANQAPALALQLLQ